MNKELENNEWKGLAPQLAVRQKCNPFVTPADYFVALESRINTSVFLNDLKKTEQTFGLQVPEDYFSQLFDQINTAINLNERIDAQKAFAVPEDYFSNLQNAITVKTTEQKQPFIAKRVKIWNSGLLKYAAAACFLVISSVGIYRYTRVNDNISSSSVANELATEQFLYDIDESTIIQNINAEKPTEVKTASTKDAAMENYLINHYTANELAQDL